MHSFCQLWIAFDVSKVSVDLVQRFEFQSCSTLNTLQDQIYSTGDSMQL